MNQVVGIFEATIYVFITDLVQFRKESSVLITGTFTLKLPFDSKLDLFENYIWVLIKVHAKSYFGLSLVSRCADTGNKYIINSQKEVINLRRKVFISSNSDSLFSNEYRYDGCHFTQEGVKALGKMYEKSFKKNIFEY